MKELPAAEIFPDDGRTSRGGFVKGRWGKHLTNKQLDDIISWSGVAFPHLTNVSTRLTSDTSEVQTLKNS